MRRARKRKSSKDMPDSCVGGVVSQFVTIEGLSPDVSHPCQRAWLQEEVAQCGYCQAGMIMTVCGLLQQHPDPRDELIDNVMSDSVCRCGTYPRIRKAIRRAANEMRTKNP